MKMLKDNIGLFAISTILLSGCAIAPSQRAEQFAFKNTLKLEIINKYSTDGLSKLIKTYDEAGTSSQLFKDKQAAIEQKTMDKKPILEALVKINNDIDNEKFNQYRRKFEAANLDIKLKTITDELKVAQDAVNADASNDNKLQVEKLQREQRKIADAISLSKASELTYSPLSDARLKDLLEQKAEKEKELTDIDKRPLVSESEASRREIRSRVVNDLLLLADIQYQEFKDGLLNGKAGGDTIMDIFELILSTATTLGNSVTAKTNLGAASTLTKGSRSSVDKNFFAQQTLASILNTVESSRLQDKTDIFKALKEKDTIDYPLARALSDVDQYFNRANLLAGVLDLTSQTESKKVAAQLGLNNAQGNGNMQNNMQGTSTEAKK